MADPKAVGQQFLAAFYQTFDTNRAALGNLYVRGSAMGVSLCTGMYAHMLSIYTTNPNRLLMHSSRMKDSY